MRNADHVLFDDRSLIKVLGRVVRRGADALDAATVSLMVRLAPLEGGQEGVMDIDDPHREGFDHLLREDLHVARHHDEIDLVVAKEFDLARFLCGLCVLGDWVDVVVDAKMLRDTFFSNSISDSVLPIIQPPLFVRFQLLHLQL